MRVIMVAVDYTDLLAITLPYNRHHFTEIHIVTDMDSLDGVFKVVKQNETVNGPKLFIHVTDAFYADEAVFNKWRALEWGLDQMGRHGWLCMMDADVLWPQQTVQPHGETDEILQMRIKRTRQSYDIVTMVSGYLYTPLRRMFTDLTQPLPPESEWGTYPIHRNIYEWAGYSQIFHTSDQALGPPPWHETNWKHAGGADSMFQRKWPRERKVRPPFEVLHIGEAGVNWMGRATPYLDGTRPERGEELKRSMLALWEGRRRAGRGRFEQEKLP